MKLNNKFIIFNSADYKDGTNNKDGYYTICLEDLKQLPDITIVGGPMPPVPKLLLFLIRVFRRLRIPTGILRPLVSKKCIDTERKSILLIRILDPTYLHWLRLKYPKGVFVLFLRDLYVTKEPSVSIYRKEKLIDIWGSYDKDEKERYNMDFFYPEIESKLSFPGLDLSPTCDIFFAGAAKNRLPRLLEAYDYFTASGLKCHFIIMDANERESDLREGIEYTKELIPYRQMLLHSIRCRCMLEINQEGAVGNTSRFLEAVMYNKRLITNSTSVKEDAFYKPEFIKIFSDIKDIDPAFVKDDSVVDYHYNNEFSPIGLIECINGILS